MPNHPRLYTPEDLAYLRAHYATGAKADIMAAFPGRAWNVIQNQAAKMKCTGRPQVVPVKQRTSWHPANLEILYALYPTGGAVAVAAATGLTANAVRNHAGRVGLRQRLRGRKPYVSRKASGSSAPKPAAAPRAPRAVRLPMTPPRADTPVINARTASKRRDRDQGSSTGLAEAIARHKKLRYGQPEHTAFLRDGLAGWQQWKAAQ